jgi:hypothetical protein
MKNTKVVVLEAKDQKIRRVAPLNDRVSVHANFCPSVYMMDQEKHLAGLCLSRECSSFDMNMSYLYIAS